MSLGKNIQYLRKQKKITQEQLAEIMSVSRQTISRWEADEIFRMFPRKCKTGLDFADMSRRMFCRKALSMYTKKTG